MAGNRHWHMANPTMANRWSIRGVVSLRRSNKKRRWKSGQSTLAGGDIFEIWDWRAWTWNLHTQDVLSSISRWLYPPSCMAAGTPFVDAEWNRKFCKSIYQGDMVYASYISTPAWIYYFFVICFWGDILTHKACYGTESAEEQQYCVER